MPLKHLTETLLIILLAVVTIVTGVMVSILPGLPEGFFPWLGVFAATLIYPAIFYPLLKENRADYPFRALHFAPAAVAIAWLLIEVAVMKEPRVAIVRGVYTWGWSAAVVGLIFLLLAVFCLQVIRRRVPRITLLILLFLPFIASAVVSEQRTHWDRQLAGLFWSDKPREIAKNDGTVGSSSKGEKNLASSADPDEEEWRKKLREVEQGKVHSSTKPVKSSAMSVPKISSSSSSKPSNLTKSGGEFEALALLFVAGYCAVIHKRARRRVLE